MYYNLHSIMKNILTLLCLVLMIIFSACTSTIDVKPEKKYTPVSQALYDTIIHMDSVLFNAFNNRDIETIKTLFTTDLEFYHDKGGLTNYDVNMTNFKIN